MNTGVYIFQNIPPGGGGEIKNACLGKKIKKDERKKEKNERKGEKGKRKGEKEGKEENVPHFGGYLEKSALKMHLKRSKIEKFSAVGEPPPLRSPSLF